MIAASRDLEALVTITHAWIGGLLFGLVADEELSRRNLGNAVATHQHGRNPISIEPGTASHGECAGPTFQGEVLGLAGQCHEAPRRRPVPQQARAHRCEVLPPVAAATGSQRKYEHQGDVQPRRPRSDERSGTVTQNLPSRLLSGSKPR